MSTPACQPMVAPSGTSLVFKFYDAATSPGMAVAEVTPGAGVPTFRINGGSPIACPRDGIFFDPAASCGSAIPFFFPPSPPGVT